VLCSIHYYRISNANPGQVVYQGRNNIAEPLQAAFAIILMCKVLKG
jgi:hypothetical protein